MKKKEKDSLLLLLKAMAVTICILLFMGLVFVAMNNTQKAISGESLQVYQNQDGLVVDVYGSQYLVELDEQTQLGDWAQTYWPVLPRPLRSIFYLIQMA